MVVLTALAASTITKAPAMTDLDALLERLTSKVHRGNYTMGQGRVNSDGTCSINGGEKIMELRNPDGPAAAAAIRELRARVEEADSLAVECAAMAQAKRDALKKDIERLTSAYAIGKAAAMFKTLLAGKMPGLSGSAVEDWLANYDP